MAIEIYDLGSTISILNDGEYTIVTKQDASVTLNGSIVALIDFSGQRYEYNFNFVNVPSETTAADLAATLNLYLQTSGSGGVNLKVSLTAEQIKNANGSPIDIGLPESGVGYYYRVTQFDAFLNYGSVQFQSNTLCIGSTLSAPGLLSSQFNIGTSNQSFLGANTSISAKGYRDVNTYVYHENDTISIWANDPSAVGDSTVDCYISVQKVKL